MEHETLEDEEKLTGGNMAESVIRIGMSVRKPATPATFAVNALLTHLHSVGFDGAPSSHGYDDIGRQMLEFVAGPLWDRGRLHSPMEFMRVGSLIRAFHDAVSTFKSSSELSWDKLSIPNGEELICHNDLAPWNLVCGPSRWTFIDWDNAAPGTRLWDLAWTALSFPPVELDRDLEDVGRDIRAIGDGYGLDRTAYQPLIGLMADRARAAANHILDGAQKNEPVALRLYAAKHHEYWGPVSDHLRRNMSVLEKLIVG